MQPQVFDATTLGKIATAKILVVGAGGIGCELVKCLSLSGFRSLSIIDLDTIDVSNLNRQFLFRREHVDKPKSLVLKEQIEAQNPNIKIEAYLGKIQEPRFGFEFFSRFDLVINALDNEAARKHVNQLCFNLGKPLIDSGTNGYEMTCISIAKGRTPCYQCIERQRDQSFPVCTIRQRPEKTIHCIVWAKALYEGIYGPKENAANPDVVDEILAELELARQESDNAGEHEKFAAMLFEKVFTKEPEKLRKTLLEGSTTKEDEVPQAEKEANKAFAAKIQPLILKELKLDEKDDQDQDHLAATVVQSIPKQAELFRDAIRRVSTERKDQIGQLTFSKDDDLSLQFVSSAANLRAACFSISLETLFKIKEMAGRIVPAISSSNALAASLQVIEAIKILSGSEQLKGIFYQRVNSTLRLNSYNRQGDKPNPQCQVCSDDSSSIVLVKCSLSCKLKELVDKMKANVELALTGNSLAIEVHDNLVYEHDAETADMLKDDNLDADERQEIQEELQMNEKRLDKTLEAFKVQTEDTIMVKADVKERGDCVFFVQILSKESVDMEMSLLKKGVGSKVELVPEEPKKPVEQVNGHVDVSSDECLELELDGGQEASPTIPKKRQNSQNGFAQADDLLATEGKRVRVE